MKNTLHLTYDMRIGGTEQVIKNLIEATDRSQYTPSILCIEAPIGPFGSMLQEQGIQIDVIPREEGFDKALIIKIRKYIKQHRIDLLHCHQYTPWVYGVLAAAFSKTRVIFTEHGRFYPDSSSWKRKLINPWLIRLTHRTTAISKATKQALIDYEAIPEKKIQVIYNGIHPLTADPEKTEQLRQSLNIPSDALILGTIARFDPIKNHQMMLNAFALVLKQHPNTHLILVGDGEERQNIEKTIDRLKITERVILTGYEAKPQHFLNLMDIFLLSSLSEGTSMTLLEAMSLSKPCVVTDAGGNAEIIKHNDNGLVTENDNAEQYAKAIEELIQKRDLRNTMANKAKQRFDKLFSADNMTTNYQTLYKTINKP